MQQKLLAQHLVALKKLQQDPAAAADELIAAREEVADAFSRLLLAQGELPALPPPLMHVLQHVRCSPQRLRRCAPPRPLQPRPLQGAAPGGSVQAGSAFI